jgi:signal transduction histidine kinase
LNGYLLIPLLAATVCTVLAVAMVSEDPRSPLNRRTGLLFAGAAWWAGCELLWNTATDPHTALLLVRVSSLGWAAIGPLALDALVIVGERPAPAARRVLPTLYGVSAAFGLLFVATGSAHSAVVRTAWGWAYVPTPIFLVFYLYTLACVVAGLAIAFRALASSSSPVERSMIRGMAFGASIPLFIASLTDVILPILGIQTVRLATASFACLGAAVAWTGGRHGHALLVPGALAREVLDTIPDGVALLTLEGRVRSVNPEMARLLGRPPAALEGLALFERMRGLDTDAADAGGDCTLESFTGRPIPVSAASRTLVDKRGLPFGRMLVLRDTREVTDLRRRLVMAGRLAAVGELAAGIAHEINNPIAFIGSNLQTLREYWGDLAKDAGRDAPLGEEARDGEELIEECLEGIARVKQIVHDVKGFAHAGEERSFVNVNGLVDAALRVARPLFPLNARLEQILSDVPLVRASARHLQQVFLNLLTNAAQAIAPDGRIRASTARRPDGVLVRISDDGCGMPAEVLDRVFDPFFTTKQVGEGTGLGLAISYQIVRSHGGEIEIDSAPGKGTEVRVFLPIEAGLEASKEEGGRPMSGRHEEREASADERTA